MPSGLVFKNWPNSLKAEKRNSYPHLSLQRIHVYWWKFVFFGGRGCDTVSSVEYFPTFRIIWFLHIQSEAVILGMLDPKDESTVILRNLRNYSPVIPHIPEDLHSGRSAKRTSNLCCIMLTGDLCKFLTADTGTPLTGDTAFWPHNPGVRRWRRDTMAGRARQSSLSVGQPDCSGRLSGAQPLSHTRVRRWTFRYCLVTRRRVLYRLLQLNFFHAPEWWSKCQYHKTVYP